MEKFLFFCVRLELACYVQIKFTYSSLALVSSERSPTITVVLQRTFLILFNYSFLFGAFTATSVAFLPSLRAYSSMQLLHESK